MVNFDWRNDDVIGFAMIIVLAAAMFTISACETPKTVLTVDEYMPLDAVCKNNCDRWSTYSDENGTWKVPHDYEIHHDYCTCYQQGSALFTFNAELKRAFVLNDECKVDKNETVCKYVQDYLEANNVTTK